MNATVGTTCKCGAVITFDGDSWSDSEGRWFCQIKGEAVLHAPVSPSVSAEQAACPKCQERPGYHADLHAGHIWTEVACPAYRTMNGDDCTCRDAGRKA